MNKTKTEKTVLITKQSSFYQNVGTHQVGFELSGHHNHAVVLTEKFVWANPFDDGGFWCPDGSEYETYTDHANMNDHETQALIEHLKSENVKHIVDSKILDELKAVK